MDDGRDARRQAPVTRSPDELNTKLSREQKAGMLFVIVCGFGALILGGQYVWTHMASPFTVNYTGSRLLTGAEQDSEDIALQKKTDTDADTLSDYNEIYLYKTSPYLNDTDSDGLTDGMEVTSGQDPNCASGSVCGDATVDDLNVDNNANPDLAAQGEALSARAQQLADLKAALAALQPSEIRTLLIQSGGDPAEINAMTDDEVMAMYQSILLQVEQQGQLDDLIPSETTPPADAATP